MCKVAQIYGMSVDEALKLSDSQANTMLEYAATAAHELIKSNPSFQKVANQPLAATRRSVRTVIGVDQ
jgi:hypothetical protein